VDGQPTETETVEAEITHHPDPDSELEVAPESRMRRRDPVSSGEARQPLSGRARG
jgi:hypothetical protein